MVVSVPRCFIPWVMSRARTDRLLQERRDQRCAAIASRQFGLISRAQALGEGLSADAIDHRLGAGRWERLLPGVFRIAGAPASWHQRLMAAILWAPRAAVSHRAAAGLWELEGCPSDRVELSTVSTRKSRVPWITLHRVGTLDRADVTSLGPIPVTTPTRTLADLCGVLNPDAVERALDDALRRNLTSMPRLRWAAQRLSGRGRPGAHVLRELIGQRRGDWTPPASFLESSAAASQASRTSRSGSSMGGSREGPAPCKSRSRLPRNESGHRSGRLPVSLGTAGLAPRPCAPQPRSRVGGGRCST